MLPSQLLQSQTGVMGYPSPERTQASHAREQHVHGSDRASPQICGRGHHAAHHLHATRDALRNLGRGREHLLLTPVLSVRVRQGAWHGQPATRCSKRLCWWAGGQGRSACDSLEWKV
jgi:hypothetical protein